MRKLLSLVLLAVLTAAGLVAATGYHVIKEVKVGGDGGWDYLTLDSAARRLYVSHATHVVVVDVDAAKVVGDIPNTDGVHGIAIDQADNRGFVSNGRSNDVTVFDLKTLKETSRVKTGMNPDSIRFESTTSRVFTFNGRSNDSTAIDAKTGKVLGTIPMGGKPEFSVADGKGKIYVNIEDTGEIVEVDAAKLMVTKRYSINPCEEPSGLAIDVKNRILFSVCGNRIMAISNPDTGKVLATPAIGAGPDGAAFDPATGYAFSSNGDGTMTIVQQMGGKWQVAENVATQRGSRTITLDEKTHNVYLPAADPGPAPAGAPAGGRGQRATFLPNSFKVLIVGK
jgi:YVTN family beta-propeller protein